MSSRKRRAPVPLIARLDAVARDLRIDNTAIAEAIGCDRTTVAKWRKIGRPPKNAAVLANLAKFVEKREKASPR